MTVQIVRADARHLPLADSSVDLIVTSPPYFALRSYQDGGEHYGGQIGSEPTPAEFLDALLEVTRECMRVLKPTGSMFVNLGDKYNSAASGQNGTAATGLSGGRHDRMGGRGSTTARIPTKSLMGIPWRYALRCIDDLGLILRAEVIWSKPNGLPESVTDRVRRSHEQWFYLQKSGDVVEAGPQDLPFCSLCGRPTDPRAPLVRRLHELNAGVKDGDLTNEVGADERVQRERASRPDEPHVVGAGGTAVPLPVPGDPTCVEDPVDLLDDGCVSAVDHESQVGALGAAVAERHAALAVELDPAYVDVICRRWQEHTGELPVNDATGEAVDFATGDV